MEDTRPRWVISISRLGPRTPRYTYMPRTSRDTYRPRIPRDTYRPRTLRDTYRPNNPIDTYRLVDQEVAMTVVVSFNQRTS